MPRDGSKPYAGFSIGRTLIEFKEPVPRIDFMGGHIFHFTPEPFDSPHLPSYLYSKKNLHTASMCRSDILQLSKKSIVAWGGWKRD